LHGFTKTEGAQEYQEVAAAPDENRQRGSWLALMDLAAAAPGNLISAI